MTVDELFETLDLDSDGAISRSELHRAARRERWHWPHARLYAVLDLLTIPGPLPRRAFISHMTQILRDPLGPFGEVLESSASASPSLLSSASRASRPRAGAREGADRPESGGDAFGAVVSLLETCHRQRAGRRLRDARPGFVRIPRRALGCGRRPLDHRPAALLHVRSLDAVRRRGRRYGGGADSTGVRPLRPPARRARSPCRDDVHPLPVSTR